MPRFIAESAHGVGKSTGQAIVLLQYAHEAMPDDRDSNAPSAPAGDKTSIPPESKPISAAPGSTSQRPGSGRPPRQQTLIGIPAPSVSGSPPATGTASSPPSRVPAPRSGGTLIGIPTPSVPAPSSPAAAALSSKPISRPPPSTDDEDWDAPPAGLHPSSRPPVLSEKEEESWDAAFEAGSSQAPTPMATPALAQRSAASALASKTAATEQNRRSTAVDSQRAAAHKPKGERSSGGSRIALFIAAAAVVGSVWFLVHSRGESVAEPPRHEPAAAPEQAKPEVSPPVRPKVEPTPVASVEAVVAASAEPTAAASASAAAANAPAAPAVASAEPQRGSEELIVVTVTTIPPDARFFYKGKPAGRSPFRVELKPGQRRSFEIGHPGFYPRKVVVDGTKREMTVAMRPEAPTPTSQVPEE